MSAGGPVPRPALLALVAVALLLRLPGLGTVGEGVDESYSVRATRAMLAGRFSYGDLNDFAIDAYQAKLTPVAEAVAVPFVAALGDAPWAFRLPSLLTSVALIVLLVRAATRRWGRAAGCVAAILTVVDYRSVYYAQTHRYVALTQLLGYGVVALLLADGPGRARRAGVALGLAVLAIHGHLLAVLLLGPLALAFAREDLLRAPRRFDRVAVVGVACAWGLAMLLVFRAIAIERFSIPPGLEGSFASTARAFLGLGPAVAVLGGLGAVHALRAPRADDRVLGATVLLGVALYAVGGLRVAMQPRYLLVLQPVAVLVAARAGGALLARCAARPGLAWALGGLILLPGAWATGGYLLHRGGRDVERTIHRALVERAAPADAVLWDVPRLDPFGFRPRAPRPVPPSHAWMDDPRGLDRLVATGVRWVVRSTASADRPIWTTEARARLDVAAVARAATSPAERDAGETVTLYRVRP